MLQYVLIVWENNYPNARRAYGPYDDVKEGRSHQEQIMTPTVLLPLKDKDLALKEEDTD